jgi:hypothetical protein
MIENLQVTGIRKGETESTYTRLKVAGPGSKWRLTWLKVACERSLPPQFVLRIFPPTLPQSASPPWRLLHLQYACAAADRTAAQLRVFFLSAEDVVDSTSLLYSSVFLSWRGKSASQLLCDQIHSAKFKNQ